MKILILDTNIVFSAVLYPNRDIGTFIMSQGELAVSFYAPTYLRLEIEKHFQKLVRLTQLPSTQVREIIFQLYKKIHFVDDSTIPFEYFRKALPLVRDIDMNDIAFVALNEYMNEFICSGDTVLYKGLKAKGYDRILNFEEAKKYILEK